MCKFRQEVNILYAKYTSYTTNFCCSNRYVAMRYLVNILLVIRVYWKELLIKWSHVQIVAFETNQQRYFQH